MRPLRRALAVVGILAATAQAQDPTREWTPPASGILYGSTAVIENQACCGPSRNDRVDNPDRAALAKWSGLAARDGRTLMLKLAGVDLEIIDLGRNPPTVATVETMPDCGGAGPISFLRPIAVWTDDRHITFEGESPLPEDDPDTKQVLRVERGRGHWQC